MIIPVKFTGGGGGVGWALGTKLFNNKRSDFQLEFISCIVNSKGVD